jgi:hypothetical protein
MLQQAATSLCMSEWLLLNANSAIFSAISWQEQVNFQWDDDEVRFVLDQHAKLDFYIASSLKQQSADTLFWFPADQTLLILLNAACLAEMQQIPILWSLVWPDQGSNPTSTALEASMLTIMPPMQFLFVWISAMQSNMYISKSCTFSIFKRSSKCLGDCH